MIVCTAVSARPGKGLVGEKFSDPEKTQVMLAGWEERPVIYDSSVREADVVVSLDQQMYRILLPGINEYARETGLKIIVYDSTCGNSAGMLSHKQIDIGGFCCPPAGMDRLPGLSFHTLGITPIAIIVHPGNPVDDIGLEQARKVFMGEIYRWSELSTREGKPGENLPIQPVVRLHCKKRPGHWRLLLADEEFFSPDISEVGTIPDMVSAVASNRRAVGHATVWFALDYYRDKGEVKAVNVNGLDPGKLGNLLSGNYPLYKTFSITLWEGEGVRNPQAEKLMERLMKQVESLGYENGIIPPSRLREAGWKFRGNELIGEPQ
jgi:hypothetical protein